MIGSDNVCIEHDVSPLIVPAATVRLRVSNTNTRAGPAAANGSRRRSQILKQSRHLEVFRARLSPGKHAPQSRPVQLKAHCMEVWVFS